MALSAFCVWTFVRGLGSQLSSVEYPCGVAGHQGRHGSLLSFFATIKTVVVPVFILQMKIAEIEFAV